MWRIRHQIFACSSRASLLAPTRGRPLHGLGSNKRTRLEGGKRRKGKERGWWVAVGRRSGHVHALDAAHLGGLDDQRDDSGGKDGRAAARVPVRTLTLALDVGHVERPDQFRLVARDDANVDVASRHQVVEDAGRDRVAHQLLGVLELEVGLPAGLHDGHGGQRARAHGGVRQLVRRAVRVDAVDVRSGGVDAAQNQRRRHVALVLEEHLLQQPVGRGHAHRPSRVQSVQFQLRRHLQRRHLEIGRRAGSGATVETIKFQFKSRER